MWEKMWENCEKYGEICENNGNKKKQRHVKNIEKLCGKC